MRLFVAIEMSDDVKDALTSMQDGMRRAKVRGNYTKRENFHITLAFIGEFGDVEKVTDALDAVKCEPFDMSLEGIGSFGSLWWAGLSESVALKTLSRRVRRALAEADIPFDRKKFSPHITLIRQPDREVIPQIPVPDASVRVSGFSLFRSDRTKNGMVYTEIAYWSF